MAEQNQLPDWRDEKALAKWLEQFPRPLITAFACRMALLALPGLGTLTDKALSRKQAVNLIMMCFRGSMSCWIAVKHPTESSAAAANAAADFGSNTVQVDAVTVAKDASAYMAFQAFAAAVHAANASSVGVLAATQPAAIAVTPSTDSDAYAAVAAYAARTAAAVVATVAVAAANVATSAAAATSQAGTMNSRISEAMKRLIEAKPQADPAVWFLEGPVFNDADSLDKFFEPLKDVISRLPKPDGWAVWLSWTLARYRSDPDWPKPVYDELTKWRDEWNRPPAEVNADIARLLERHANSAKPSEVDANEEALINSIRSLPVSFRTEITLRAALRSLPLIHETWSHQKDKAEIRESTLRCFQCAAFVSRHAIDTDAAQDALIDTIDVLRLIASAKLLASSEDAAIAGLPLDATHSEWPIEAMGALARGFDMRDEKSFEYAIRCAHLAIQVTDGRPQAIAQFDRNLVADARTARMLAGTGSGLETFSRRRLFADANPEELADNFRQLKPILLARDEHWDVWLNWYAGRMEGLDVWPPEIYSTILNWRDEWNRPPAEVNADIKRLLELYQPEPSRQEIIDAASPSARLTSEGQLDLVPNPIFDKPEASADLASLPFMQLAVCRALRDALPPNTAKVIPQALGEYAAELQTRGVRPILGILKQMFEIVESGLGKTPEAREWMPDALRTAFDHYERNHRELMAHFPLDLLRDQMFARVKVDETKADENSKNLGKAIANVVRALHELNKATDQALDTSKRLDEGATIVANTPDPQLVTTPSGDNGHKMSAKKRNLVGLLATAGSIIGVVSGLAAIADSPAVMAALRVLKELWDKPWFG